MTLWGEKGPGRLPEEPEQSSTTWPQLELEVPGPCRATPVSGPSGWFWPRIWEASGFRPPSREPPEALFPEGRTRVSRRRRGWALGAGGTLARGAGLSGGPLPFRISLFLPLVLLRRGATCCRDERTRGWGDGTPSLASMAAGALCSRTARLPTFNSWGGGGGAFFPVPHLQSGQNCSPFFYFEEWTRGFSMREISPSLFLCSRNVPRPAGASQRLEEAPRFPSPEPRCRPCSGPPGLVPPSIGPNRGQLS